jgi:hypothetical protein
MYTRVQRWHREAFAAPGSADLGVDFAYAFFVFCYHLKDWIKNDVTVAPNVRGQVESFVKSSPALALAGDIANGFKHLVRDRPGSVDAGARIEARGPRLGMDFSLGTSVLGAAIMIVGDQGPRFARDIADDCIKAWDQFVQGTGLS